MKFIPETLAPHLSEEAVEIWHKGGDKEEADEETFLPGRGFSKPRRYDGDEEVEADEGIHEPQMAGKRREIERYAREIAHRCLTVDLIPQHRHSGIDHHEEQKRRKNPPGPSLIKLHRCLPLLHGHKQERRDYHEERHRHARESVIRIVAQ